MSKKPLYLAKNLNDLHKLVKKSSNYGRKFEVLCRASDTLYNNAVDVKQKEPLDEEMLYVYCTRYLNLISTIKSQVNDDQFVNTRFAKSINFIEDLQKQCDASLWERYKDNLEPIEVDNKHIEEAMADVVENNKSSLLKKIKDDDAAAAAALNDEDSDSPAPTLDNTEPNPLTSDNTAQTIESTIRNTPPKSEDGDQLKTSPLKPVAGGDSNSSTPNKSEDGDQLKTSPLKPVAGGDSESKTPTLESTTLNSDSKSEDLDEQKMLPPKPIAGGDSAPTLESATDGTPTKSEDLDEQKMSLPKPIGGGDLDNTARTLGSIVPNSDSTPSEDQLKMQPPKPVDGGDSDSTAPTLANSDSTPTKSEDIEGTVKEAPSVEVDLALYQFATPVDKICVKRPDSSLTPVQMILSYFGKSLRRLNRHIFVTSDLFYDVITDDRLRILVLDARCENDFKETRVKCKYIINIPSDIIKKGLTTNTISQLMNDESKEMFEKRHDFDLVILLDEDTNKISYRCSKLEDLRIILVEWDIKQKYQILPLVLDGGLKIFCDFYPTQITNPGRVYNRTYMSFDDIFKDVYYPEELLPTPKELLESPPPGGFKKQEDLEDPLALKLLKKILALTLRSLDIEQSMKNSAEGHQGILKEEQIEIHKKMTYIKKKYNDCPDEDVSDPIFQTLMDKVRNVEIQVMATRKENLANLELRPTINRDTKPQTHKPKLEPDNVESASTSETKSVPVERAQPVVPDRSTKPTQLNISALMIQLERKFRHSGFRGLVNIRNTCYMNSIVQCVRFIPSVLCFFNINIDSNRRHPMTSKLGTTIIALWSTNNDSGRGYKSDDFYHVVCATDADMIFARGRHEDSHELFLHVLTIMMNELQVTVTSVNGELTGRAKDWVRNFKNMTSFFLTEFWHQLEFTTSCDKCNKVVVKYEYGNTIFLPLPPEEQTFRLQDALEEYFNVIPADENKFCTSCETKLVHTKKVTYYPNVLVINLVRHRFCTKEKTILRCSNRCIFTENIIFDGLKYKLNAMSLHSGNRDFGHYTALVFHNFARKWLTFNDEDVYFCDNIYTNEIYKRTYLLFYTLDSNINVNETFFSPPDEEQEKAEREKDERDRAERERAAREKKEQ